MSIPNRHVQTKTIKIKTLKQTIFFSRERIRILLVYFSTRPSFLRASVRPIQKAMRADEFLEKMT